MGEFSGPDEGDARLKGGAGKDVINGRRTTPSAADIERAQRTGGQFFAGRPGDPTTPGGSNFFGGRFDEPTGRDPGFFRNLPGVGTFISLLGAPAAGAVRRSRALDAAVGLTNLERTLPENRRFAGLSGGELRAALPRGQRGGVIARVEDPLSGGDPFGDEGQLVPTGGQPVNGGLGDEPPKTTSSASRRRSKRRGFTLGGTAGLGGLQRIEKSPLGRRT